MKTGTLNVETQNIFPIIKKFLYSDEEIFLRELVSNAVDATQKLQMLVRKGEINQEVGELDIQVKLDKEGRTLTISDRGIGMTEEEVDRYLNQIAFSSAQDFVEKFKDVDDKKQIIGQFGLGFYSAFMVAKKVEVITRSYKEDAQPVRWICEGDTEFTIEEAEKEQRGTDIILHITEDADEYLEKERIQMLLNKYCSFMPVPIQFDGEQVNNTDPIWLKQPSDLTSQNYQDFYKELYPMSNPPLFWIHLNVDYPFRLTGILYFPKLTNSMELQKNKIQLYQNQVFVTDEVKDIVPEFLTLLHGVIDSPDIPLNVSRSYLQADRNVKRISSYIVKKVAEKLQELFKSDRKAYEEKWEEIEVFVKYGMLSDDKFREKAKEICLLENTEGQFFTFDEYREKVKAQQTDKDDKVVFLYTSDPQEQDSYIQLARQRDYDVLVMKEVIDNHFVQMLEQELENVSIKRVDSESMDKLIDKGEEQKSELSDEEQAKVKDAFESITDKEKFIVEASPLTPQDPPVLITRNEFMRRMSDMTKLGGGMMGGQLPEKYELKVNTNHPVAKRLATAETTQEREQLASQVFDLARLSQNMLKGKELTEFIQRNIGKLTLG